ncbi:hypothetical protein Tsubulata_031630 [Turnera subulata]|uniref:Uncharacterized protein n=1 Tax=Turnera subulata TaxID=218843 RepID=A0A9Q0J693_9ROSI|nr:hypothetical protein Tsubulata_031630 [Turnera subulata]
MAWNLLLWILSLLMTLALLALLFHSLLCLTDLEVDHLNPFEAAARINKWVLPEFVLQGALCTLFLLTGHWIMFLLAVPVTSYHIMLFVKRQHLIDVTEVFRNLNFDKKYRLVKLGFYMVFFMVLIFRFVLHKNPGFPLNIFYGSFLLLVYRCGLYIQCCLFV